MIVVKIWCTLHRTKFFGVAQYWLRNYDLLAPNQEYSGELPSPLPNRLKLFFDIQKVSFWVSSVHKFRCPQQRVNILMKFLQSCVRLVLEILDFLNKFQFLAPIDAYRYHKL